MIKSNYQKPYARNLGEVLPFVFGHCKNGTSATSPDCKAGSAVLGHCESGPTAKGPGAGCDEGSVASPKCANGGTIV